MEFADTFLVDLQKPEWALTPDKAPQIEKAMKILNLLLTAKNSCLSLEDKLRKHLAEEQAASVGTVEDNSSDDTSSDAERALNRALEETARLAHAYLANGSLSASSDDDSGGNGSLC